MWREVLGRLRSLRRWRRQETELDEEIRVHLAMEMEERIAAGMSPEDARAAAQRDFGNVPLIRELTRESWGWGPAERLLQDIRSAIRGMRRNPGYTCTVILTLALGIGLNAAMYGMLSRLFLQAPPHIENPDGIHRVWVRRGDRDDPARVYDSLDWNEFTALLTDSGRFSAAGRYSTPWPTPNGRGQTAEELQVSRVTGGFFGLLGARPALGRLILPEDDDPAAAPVAVIGNSYRERRFGGARQALGATVTFDDVTYTIVGAMPPGFSGSEPSAVDVWVPRQVAETGSRTSSVTAFVRLAPGVTADAAGAAATALLSAARADSNETGNEATVALGPLMKTRGPAALEGNMRLPLVVGGVSLVVLLIATANVSNLLMLRVAARRREMAVRHALGAGRWGVRRMLVVESVMLAALSGVAALGVAAVTGRVLRFMLLPRHRWDGGPLDTTAIAFTGAVVLGVGLAAALLPALYAARSRGIERLDGLRGARPLGAPVRTGLIVVQAALSLILLNGAATFYRSFEAAREIDVGYARENLLTVRLNRGARQSTPLNETTVDALEARVRSLPGVLDVAQSTNTPQTAAAARAWLRVEGLDRLRFAPFDNYVTPNFFRVAGLDIRDGRGFTEGDRAGARRVAIVNAAFARQAWPEQRAVGRCLFLGWEASDCATVVGVAEAALEFGLRDSNRAPHYYVPIEQAAAVAETAEYLRRDRSLVVRTQGDPARTVPPVLTALAELFPDLPASRVRSLTAVHAGRIRSWTIGTGLLGAAALLALLLTTLGLYAVIAFGVRQRELEFGIRRALGAQAWNLLRLVLGRGLSLVVIGIVAGGLAALWAGRFIAPLLFEGRSPRDPLALTAAALVLVAAALAASFLPARRAAQADPRQALQAE